MTDDRQTAIADFKRSMKWIAIIAFLMVVGALSYIRLYEPLNATVVIATTLGVFFSVLLGCGLFAAAFFSDKSGLDQQVADATRSEREHRPVQGPPKGASHDRLSANQVRTGPGPHRTAVHARAERRSDPFDESGRLRSKDDRHRRPNPDGIAVDAEAGHIYWTNMGIPSRNDGSIERAELDGGNRTTIIRRASPSRRSRSTSIRWRQALLVRPRGDARDAREPRRLDSRDARRDRPRRRGPPRPDRWCVGITIDPEGGNSTGRRRAATMRASAHLPRRHRHAAGESAANRSDIELLFDRLPEPIDLDLDRVRPGPLLDRSRRSSARQHRQPRRIDEPARLRRLSSATSWRASALPSTSRATGCSSPTLPVSLYSADLDGSNRATCSRRKAT
jgi:hypothetical protein